MEFGLGSFFAGNLLSIYVNPFYLGIYYLLLPQLSLPLWCLSGGRKLRMPARPRRPSGRSSSMKRLFQPPNESDSSDHR